MIKATLQNFQIIYAAFTCAPLKKGKATTWSPPCENDFVEKVVAPGQEAFLHSVRLDAQRVALLLNVHLYTVQ